MFDWIEKQVDGQIKRRRGESKLAHVHTRSEKKVITMNNLIQPVSDDNKLTSEFSNFLGTTVREFVSLTCRSWREVPDKDILWEYVKVNTLTIA